MSTERIKSLLIKHLDEGLTEADKQELESWMDESEFNREVGEEILNDEQLKRGVKEMYDRREAVWAKVKPEQAKVIRMSNWKKVFAASAVIILLIAGYFLFRETGDGKRETGNIKVQDVPAPDSTKATITLANGKVIIPKVENGEVEYVRETEYAILNNPRGSKIVSITLDDGTKVWLNSESSLKYPVEFNRGGREVLITGEAYFEVAKDSKRKFIVTAGETTTEVLGTHFNINSYEQTTVTLLEGSVRVTLSASAVKLRPNEQVTDGRITEANVEEVIAWKNGQFLFTDASIESIMSQVSRWYDAEVIYEGNIPGKFVADISRDVPVSQLLHILELTNRVHFKIEGKRIIVSP